MLGLFDGHIDSTCSGEYIAIVGFPKSGIEEYTSHLLSLWGLGNATWKVGVGITVLADILPNDGDNVMSVHLVAETHKFIARLGEL